MASLVRNNNFTTWYRLWNGKEFLTNWCVAVHYKFNIHLPYGRHYDIERGISLLDCNFYLEGNSPQLFEESKGDYDEIVSIHPVFWSKGSPRQVVMHMWLGLNIMCLVLVYVAI